MSEVKDALRGLFINEYNSTLVYLLLLITAPVWATCLVVVLLWFGAARRLDNITTI